MKYWTDEKTGTPMSEPDCADEWLFNIWALAVDYDGCQTVEELKKLIDELVAMSQSARDCLHDGKIYPPEYYCSDELSVLIGCAGTCETCDKYIMKGSSDE